MELNGYGVSISRKNVRLPEVKAGYVQLNHEDQFEIELINNTNKRAKADVSITINGKSEPVGTFICASYRTGYVDSKINDKGLLTFYKLDTAEASAAGLDSTEHEQGLVTVTFRPELVWEPPAIERVSRSANKGGGEGNYSYGMEKGITTRGSGAGRGGSAGGQSVGSAGGVGLSGQRQQDYKVGKDFATEDMNATTIHVRLVCAPEQQQAHLGPRPFKSTPIPPAV